MRIKRARYESYAARSYVNTRDGLQVGEEQKEGV